MFYVTRFSGYIFCFREFHDFPLEYSFVNKGNASMWLTVFLSDWNVTWSVLYNLWVVRYSLTLLSYHWESYVRKVMTKTGDDSEWYDVSVFSAWSHETHIIVVTSLLLFWYVALCVSCEEMSNALSVLSVQAVCSSFCLAKWRMFFRITNATMSITLADDPHPHVLSSSLLFFLLPERDEMLSVKWRLLMSPYCVILQITSCEMVCFLQW